MTRQQLEDEYSRLRCLLGEPKPDLAAVEDAFRRVHLATLRWQDYAGGLLRSVDDFRRLCGDLMAEKAELIRHLDKAREGNAILLRAMKHGEKARVPMSREECVRLCREVG